MNTNNREKEIFEKALDLTSPEARRGYVKGACDGDADLLARVETLLRAHEATGGFLPDHPGAAAGPTVSMAHSDMSEKPGTMIGRYKLLQQIGEGGCGVVYMAEQEVPVRRRVALKVIKLGMDTKEVIARFEAERQALAMMDHPNIAKVLDAGATASGRPYFVMELVRGLPITKYCDEAKLSARARLELFIPVCHAIQHAHQKGIIHRDIKPSNVLVTINDGVAVSKVIDFGIAKATQGRLTDHTLFTAFDQFIGTPTYMSPEQAAMTSLDIDTRSDIYSLGVLLYELLVGRPPFDPQSLVKAGLDEIRRQIREVEPPRMSTRVSTLPNADQTTTANLRQIEAPKLVNLLRGDLDWIVMRCLEKDRSRRYETATGLALDLHRHLHDEPVTARPPSTAYRVQKLVVRNKLAVAAAAVVTAALISGLVVSTWAYFNEKSARQFAVDAALAQKQAKDKNTDVMKTAADFRRRAEASEKQATIASAKETYAVAVMNDLVRATESGVSPSSGQTKASLALTAERLRQDAKIPPEAKQELCDTFGDLFMAMGEYNKAELMYRQTLALRRELWGEGNTETTKAVDKLIEALKKQGKGTEAATTLSQAKDQRLEFFQSERWAKQLKKEAQGLQAQGLFAKAEAKLQEAMANAQARLGEEYNPTEEIGLLARLRYEAGDFSGAKQLANQCIIAEKAGRRWQDAGTLGSFTQIEGKTYVTPFDAHTILGLIALHEGEKSAAQAHLLRSAYSVTRWSKIEGRNLELATALAASGERDTVMQFLDRVRPRYVESMETRDLNNTAFAQNGAMYEHAAIGKQRAQELGNWRMELSAGKIPTDWEFLDGPEKLALPASVSAQPSLAKLPVRLPESARGLYRPLLPFAFLMLGWCATAFAPRLGPRRPLPTAAAAWLIGFCVVRTVDVALFAGAIIGDGFLPGMFTGIYLSFLSWVLLWKFLCALIPGESSRWERRFMNGAAGLGLLEIGSMQVIGYMNGDMWFIMICIIGLLLLLLLTFALAFGVCYTAGKRLWRWQRSADLSRNQQLCLKFAVPLLVVHGYVSMFSGIIHDNSSPIVSSAIFWVTALLPWLLAAGFYGAAPRNQADPAHS